MTDKKTPPDEILVVPRFASNENLLMRDALVPPLEGLDAATFRFQRELQELEASLRKESAEALVREAESPGIAEVRGIAAAFPLKNLSAGSVNFMNVPLRRPPPTLTRIQRIRLWLANGIDAVANWLDERLERLADRVGGPERRWWR